MLEHAQVKVLLSYYLCEKNLRHWLIPSGDIDGQTFPQSD